VQQTFSVRQHPVQIMLMHLQSSKKVLKVSFHEKQSNLWTKLPKKFRQMKVSFFALVATNNLFTASW